MYGAQGAFLHLRIERGLNVQRLAHLKGTHLLMPSIAHRRLRVEAAFYSAQRPALPVTVTVTATNGKLPSLQVC